ncbi:MAG TPA: hypothetical protein VI522_07385, partial [Gammaproteobacteria bacterium]|nr:hypothetical protein [Gammaproteobacteria bacterium]
MSLSNPSASATLTRTNLDLSGATFNTIIDDDVVDTLIADIAEPVNPQYTRTILAGDIPTSSLVTNFAAFLSIGGANTDIAARTINCQFTLNGVNVGVASSVSVTAAQFWRCTMLYANIALVA